MSRSGQTQVFYRGCRFGLAPGTAAFWRVAGGLRNDRDGFPIRLSLVELESWHVEVVPVVRLVAHDHAPLGEPTDGTFHHFQAHIPALRVELGPQPGRVILRSPFAVEAIGMTAQVSRVKSSGMSLTSSLSTNLAWSLRHCGID